MGKVDGAERHDSSPQWTEVAQVARRQDGVLGVIRLQAAHPEIPPPRRNVRLGPWEIDFLWPEHQLAVETDGDQYHCTPAELERDRVKDAWLQRRRSRCCASPSSTSHTIDPLSGLTCSHYSTYTLPVHERA